MKNSFPSAQPSARLVRAPYARQRQSTLACACAAAGVNGAYDGATFSVSPAPQPSFAAAAQYCAQQGAAGATLKYNPIGLGLTLRDSRGPGVPQGYQAAPIDGPWTTTQVGAVTADVARREFTFRGDHDTVFMQSGTYRTIVEHGRLDGGPQPPRSADVA